MMTLATTDLFPAISGVKVPRRMRGTSQTMMEAPCA
jgi:hypothetical protein